MSMTFCSRCGKTIDGSCGKCREQVRADLARRQAIPPGSPAIRGEMREADDGMAHLERLAKESRKALRSRDEV
jgi:hypothetical protein